MILKDITIPVAIQIGQKNDGAHVGFFDGLGITKCQDMGPILSESRDTNPPTRIIGMTRLI